MIIFFKTIPRAMFLARVSGHPPFIRYLILDCIPRRFRVRGRGRFLSLSKTLAMTAEAEFDREAAQMLSNVGLTDVEKLSFFQRNTAKSDKWKEGFRKPQPRVKRVRARASFAQRKASDVGSSSSNANESGDPRKVQAQVSTTISNLDSTPRGRVVRTKSAPECGGEPLSPSAEGSDIHLRKSSELNVQSTIGSLPSSVSFDKRPLSSSGKDGGGYCRTKVLYSQRSSLKLLSVTNITSRTVEPTSVTCTGSSGCFPLAQLQLEGIECTGRSVSLQQPTCTCAIPSSKESAYDRLQDVNCSTELSKKQVPCSARSEKNVTLVTSSDSFVCDTHSDSDCYTKPTICDIEFQDQIPSCVAEAPKTMVTPTSLTAFGNKCCPGRVAAQVSNEKEGIVSFESSLLLTRSDPSIAAMNRVATNTMLALGTLVEAVTPITVETQPPHQPCRKLETTADCATEEQSAPTKPPNPNNCPVNMFDALHDSPSLPFSTNRRCMYESDSNTPLVHESEVIYSKPVSTAPEDQRNSRMEEQDDFFGKEH